MANLNHACRMKGIILNMEALYTWFKHRFNAQIIYIFTGYLQNYEQEYLLNKQLGYVYIFKEAVFNIDEGKIKANCDVDIAIQGIADIFEINLSSAVLVSSDGDFLSLIRFWQSRNILVRLLSPADSEKCSYLLKKINIPITYMNQVMNKFINEKALDEDKTS